ncbi:MAG: response regulator transcription factor [Clostridiales bacterium]|nr:response regulator transcription factor [Clostridiales bacterium]
MKRICVVEDEELVREELSSMLEKSGYIVSTVDSFDDVTSDILKSSPDLVLLDINLPNMSGFQICRELKNKSSVPVVILTSRDDLRDELNALELGADEFMTKPYRKERLLLRISNVLKRYEGRSNLIEGPGFLLDKLTYTLYIDGTSVILPKNQGKIIEVLLRKRGEEVSRQEISEEVWGTSEFIDENALQVNLTRLKKTMASLNMNCTVVAVRGKGYKIVELEE